MIQAYAIYWVLFTNAMAFIEMVRDKHLAETGKRRIAESSLIGWMVLGGAPAGLLASRLVRHKTRKQPFAGQMKLLAIVWGVLLILWPLGVLDPLIAQALAILTQGL